MSQCINITMYKCQSVLLSKFINTYALMWVGVKVYQCQGVIESQCSRIRRNEYGSINMY